MRIAMSPVGKRINNSIFSSKVKQGGVERTTKTIHSVRLRVREEANAVSPMKWNGNKLQRGFTYIMMMVAVMVVGLAAGVGITLVSREVQADREMELLFRGMAYRDAIRHYYHAGQGLNSYPRSLEALLMDPRSPGKRYLRTLYRDPMGGAKGEWQLIRGVDGAIIGVASRSKAVPFKQVNFPVGYENFADARAYSEWIFSYTPTNNPRTRNN